MKSIDIPGTKWVEAWGKNTPLTNIRAIPQTTATPGFASQDQGFSPTNATPIAGGGIPPFIQDVNGAFNFFSSWSIWMTAGGGLVPWDSSFSTAVGGYPKGSTVLSATTFGAYYVSSVDDNTSNPDAGGANWVPGSLLGSDTSGDVKMSYKTTADVGWIPMNDGSIGDGSSGASTRANADTQPLFSVMYNNMTDANAPIQTSGGGATTRGAQGTAAAAFAAHCRLVLPKMLGRALFAAGAGAGLTSRALGQSGGVEFISGTQLPNITLHVNVYQTAARGPGPGDSTGQTAGGTQSTVTDWPGTGAQFLPPYASANPFVKL